MSTLSVTVFLGLRPLESVRHRNAYVLEREGNGLETYLLLAHIRRWGSISITEACQLLGISPTTAQELLDWLVRRVEVEARWGDASPLDQARNRQGRVYFAQTDQTPEPTEPGVRRSKEQKKRDAAEKYHPRRHFPSR